MSIFKFRELICKHISDKKKKKKKEKEYSLAVTRKNNLAWKNHSFREVTSSFLSANIFILFLRKINKAFYVKGLIYDMVNNVVLRKS